MCSRHGEGPHVGLAKHGQRDIGCVLLATVTNSRLTPHDEHASAMLAETDCVSRQEETARAIQETASRQLRDYKIRTVSARARERYADLLVRLGT